MNCCRLLVRNISQFQLHTHTVRDSNVSKWYIWGCAVGFAASHESLFSQCDAFISKASRQLSLMFSVINWTFVSNAKPFRGIFSGMKEITPSDQWRTQWRAPGDHRVTDGLRADTVWPHDAISGARICVASTLSDINCFGLRCHFIPEREREEDNNDDDDDDGPLLFVDSQWRRASSWRSAAATHSLKTTTLQSLSLSVMSLFLIETWESFIHSYLNKLFYLNN